MDDRYLTRGATLSISSSSHFAVILVLSKSLVLQLKTSMFCNIENQFTRTSISERGPLHARKNSVLLGETETYE